MPYPHPIPLPEVPKLTQQRRAPVCDNDPHYFKNSYEKATLLIEPKNELGESQGSENKGDHGKDEGDGEAIEAAGASGHAIEASKHAHHADISTEDKPCTYSEVMNCSDSDLWYKAIMDELNTFEKIGLYKVNCPPN